MLHLERHGVSCTRSNTTYWLAACASEDIGRVSPHLLDRFTARLPAARAVPLINPIARVLAALNGEAEPEYPIPDAPAAWLRMLADKVPPAAVSPVAVGRAVALHDAAVGMRRPLALLRLARAFARFDGASEVEAWHVDEAAAFIGLSTTAKNDPARPAEQHQATEAETPEARPSATPRQLPAGGPGGRTGLVPTPIMEGGAGEALEPIALALAGNPYPEDVAEPEREATPLVLPWQRRSGTPSDRGEVVGTEPTNRLVDIAWKATFREAAKYQVIRGRTGADEPLLLSPSDLRRHRRTPKADHLLVLVLDHTCHRDWDWMPALAEHLRAAYTRRSTVCVVDVGAPGAEVPVRAQRTMARSLLDPRVAAALENTHGTATPLAHGLELARTTLCHALQHGRTPVDEATLVVVTDGLGNVPLDASLRGAVDGLVRGQGIDDAIAAGRAIAELDGVRPVVVLPPRLPLPDVPLDLARALGPDCLVVS
ncbi:magnesium chelatase subunit D [Lentzea albidocapillata subsp. violacea]|uniref:Magnesium chelatase subunit D n=1 Tax=Lentzea albidocapillata subsp. violacea TaxID=128104 RepID=A0A1G8SGH1_9PSEU|nr:hypothetical protein [Lentzea albidocapillata]SDJ28342.1 magnesium chelatase subunit D [Lentzea albidocapillata subsp. violacea]